MREIKKRVEGRDDLYRNSKGAIVNTDSRAFEAYKKKRDSNVRREETISSLGDQLEDAKKEIDELKSLIKSLIDK